MANKPTSTVSATNSTHTTHTQKLCILALLAAVGYLSMFVIKLKMFGFLSYEMKDVFLVLGGFLYGPGAAAFLSVVTSLLELPTSDTGIIGFLMNVISSFLFSVTASWIYMRRRTLGGAVLGLICGVCAMTAGMLLWNYLITPLYMHVSRKDVAGMLTTIFLPFNLVKATLNAAVTMLIYKPFTRALRMLHLLPVSDKKQSPRATVITLFLSILVIALCIAAILKINNII